MIFGVVSALHSCVGGFEEVGVIVQFQMDVGT
jgi:hypothetical protein